MSRAAKITFGASLAFSALTAVSVYYFQELERDNIKQGPIKDAARLEQRKKKEQDLSGKQKANLQDFEMQKRLKEELQKDQPLTGEVVYGVSEK